MMENNVYNISSLTTGKYMGGGVILLLFEQSVFVQNPMF